MRDEGRLLQLQREFLSALLSPIYDESRKRTDLPIREGSLPSSFYQTAEKYILPSKNLKSWQRLELYHRQYWYRLLDSMEEDFPGLKALLGKDEFFRLVEFYLEAHPPRSFSLRYLGSEFSEFISKNPGMATNPIHAAEMAMLEYARCLCFEAPSLPPVEPEKIATEAIQLQPHIFLLAFTTPVDRIWRKCMREKAIRFRPAENTSKKYDLVVYRSGFEICTSRLSEGAFRILSTIQETGSLSKTFEIIEASRTDSWALTPENVTHYFQKWVSLGWFCRSMG